MAKYLFNFENSYLSLPREFYTKNNPTPVTNPKLALFNSVLANSMGLDFSDSQATELAELFSGNNIPPLTETFSQSYAGHQYGNFTILGDGRAHILGEHITPDKQRLDIQFKGSGRTPYSRSGDGRATIGPMLREYLISEAMHGLGIPTTRSLAVVTTGEMIQREILLPGAILTRVASSHIRIGTFEFAAVVDNKSMLEQLFKYTVDRHYPKIKTSTNIVVEFLKQIMQVQVDLIANWMRVGFIHGVMNTDNMSISGETIDYGPCAFMDVYDPNTVFSSIDSNGRYSYANQPAIAQWNLARLAEALLPLISSDTKKAIAVAQNTLQEFSAIFHNKWLTMMRAKLGLFSAHNEDETLIHDLLEWMHTNHADYTNTFSDLRKINTIENELYKHQNFIEWHERWQNRLRAEDKPIEHCFNLMQQNNPEVIPRNHKVEQALTAAQEGNYDPIKNFIEVIKDPYQDNESLTTYKQPPQPQERIYQTFCGT